MPATQSEPAVDLDDLEALEETVRAGARDDLLLFTLYTYQDPRGYRVNWHHKLLASYLERFARGEIKRLILAAPPRTGKSELVSLRMPAYILGREPSAKIIAASHTDLFARSWSRKIQRLITTPNFRALFPETRIQSLVAGSERWGQEWKQTERQFDLVGHGDNYLCLGRGGAAAGVGADYILVDDPYRSRKDASSARVQDDTWEWYNDDLRTRLDGDGGICIMATRWHERDLTGLLLAEEAEDETGEKWEVLILPAIADGDLHPLDPRKDGETLWPWRWGGRRDDISQAELEQRARKVLEERRARNPYGFDSLYQQTPKPKKGEFFMPERIEIVDKPPAARQKTVRYWDKAGTEGGGKYTAGLKMSLLKDKSYLIENLTRGQWSAFRREENLKAIAQTDGKAITIIIEQEPGSGGKESFEASAKNLAGWSVRKDPPTGDKAVRAEPFSAQVEARNVKMLRGDWNEAYVNELRAFRASPPHGAFTDQVDASSGAFNHLAKGWTYGALAEM